MSSTREKIIIALSTANGALTDAYKIATSANAMAADIPAFQELLQLQKRLGELMQQVNKVRGL